MRSIELIVALGLLGCEHRGEVGGAGGSEASDGSSVGSAQTSSSGGSIHCPMAGHECRVVDLEAGGTGFTFAIWNDGSTTCWGEDPYNFCAVPHGGILEVPMFVPNLLGVSDISLGGDTQSALTTGRFGLIWGAAVRGERGAGVDAPNFVPTIVGALPSLEKIRTGGGVTAVLDDAGRIGWWGTMSTEFGPALQASPVWEALPAMLDVDVGATICSVDFDGGVYCWGSNQFGMLGDGSTGNRRAPGRVSSLSDAEVVDVGIGYVCVIRKAGRVSCWGVNRDGQLGRGGEVIPGTLPFPFEPFPGDVLLPEPATAVSLGLSAACAIVAGGRVYCWGRNEENMFHPTLTHTATPVLVPDLTDVVDIAVGLIHLCVLKSDHSVWCRGNPVSLGRDREGGNALGQVDFSKTVMP